MIQKLLIIFSILFCSTVFAQDPDLIGDWQLTELILDGESLIPPSDSEVELVWLEINPAAPSEERFRTNACNVLFGDISFQGTDEMTLTIVGQTLGGCVVAGNQNYELAYFDFYYNNLGSFNYVITDLGNDVKQLVITDNVGNEAIYHSELLRQYVFKTWYLQELILDGSNIEVPEGEDFFNPAITFNHTFDPAIASFSGDTGCSDFIGENTFISNTRELTIIQSTINALPCENQTQSDFEALYSNFLFENTPQPLTYLLIEPSENVIFTLRKGNDYAVYGENPVNLGIEEKNVSAITIFPNPVSTTLFIAAENLVLTRLSIYSATGKAILNVNSPAYEIDVSELASGIYFIELAVKDNRTIRKFVKQ